MFFVQMEFFDAMPLHSAERCVLWKSAARQKDWFEAICVFVLARESSLVLPLSG